MLLIQTMKPQSSSITPGATLPWAPRTHPSKERPTVFRKEKPFRRGWSYWSRLQRRSWGEKPNQKQLDQRFWSHKVQWQAFDVMTQAVEFVRWKCANHKLEKASPVFIKLFTHQDEQCFCHNVISLFKAFGIACKPQQVVPLPQKLIQETQSCAAS